MKLVLNMIDDGFPLMGMCENINCFSWARGYPCFKQSSVEFSTKSWGYPCFKRSSVEFLAKS